MLNPADPLATDRLATFYSMRKRYKSLVEFFHRRAAFLSSEDDAVGEEQDAVDLVPCNLFSGPFDKAHKEAEEGDQAADRLGQMIHDGAYPAVLVAQGADSAVATYGNQCHLLAEWSLSMLRLFLEEPEQYDITREELALRILVVLAGRGTLPSGLSGVPSVYLFLADYWMARGDDVSAYIAVLTAKEMIRSGVSTGSLDTERLGDIVNGRLKSLRLQAEAVRRDRSRR